MEKREQFKKLFTLFFILGGSLFITGLIVQITGDATSILPISILGGLFIAFGIPGLILGIVFLVLFLTIFNNVNNNSNDNSNANKEIDFNDDSNDEIKNEPKYDDFIFCLHCGAKNNRGEKYCSGCGAALGK